MTTTLPYLLPEGVYVVGFVVLANDVPITNVYTSFEAWIVGIANAAHNTSTMSPVIVPVVNTDAWITTDAE